jgi:hypothetical protein
VLAGVGGRTIEEAKARLSYDEYLRWLQYARKRGGFNLGMRIEEAAAIVAQQVNNGAGGKAKMVDFLMHRDEELASLTDVFGLLKSKAQASAAQG